MISDYLSLKTALLGVNSFTHRTDLSSVIDTFVHSATSRINRTVKAQVMEKSAILVSSTKDFTLPTDYNFMRSVVTDDKELVSSITPLQAADEDWSRESFYSTHGGILELRPEPSVSTNLNIKYYSKLANLVNDADTNTLLVDYPNLYIYGVMIEFSLFTEDDDRLNLWTQFFKDEVFDVNGVEDMSRHDSTMSIRVF